MRASQPTSGDVLAHGRYAGTLGDVWYSLALVSVWVYRDRIEAKPPFGRRRTIIPSGVLDVRWQRGSVNGLVITFRTDREVTKLLLRTDRSDPVAAAIEAWLRGTRPDVLAASGAIATTDPELTLGHVAFTVFGLGFFAFILVTIGGEGIRRGSILEIGIAAAVFFGAVVIAARELWRAAH